MVTVPLRCLLGHRAVARPAAARADIDWPIWWATFLSLTCYNLAMGVSPVLMLMFLTSWMVYLLAWPARGIERMASTMLPWIFPILALTSTLWSQAPMITLRNALEVLLVTGVGLLIARAQSARSFISAFMCTLLVCVLIGIAFGSKASVGIKGDTALIGVFSSKNYFALMISLMMLLCAAVLIDPKQPRALRMLGIFGCLIGPPFLILAKSLGAMITLVIALSCLGGFTLASRMRTRSRPAFYVGAALFVLSGFGMLLLLLSTGTLELWLRSFGKDTGLTGRTYLWSRADWLIPLNPFGGVGYQAFWVQESVEAEGLWRFSDIISRTGFHFHNLYYETAIELGYIGVVVLGTTLGALVCVALVAVFRQPSTEYALFVAVIVILGARAYVELDFIQPFAIGTLLIPILWSYCIRQNGPAPRLIMRRPSPFSRHLADPVGSRRSCS
jgi:exopolysaccharide production protein ExoQ